MVTLAVLTVLTKNRALLIAVILIMRWLRSMYQQMIAYITGSGAVAMRLAGPVKTVTFQPPTFIAGSTSYFQAIAVTFEPISRLSHRFSVRTTVYCIAKKHSMR